MSFSLHHVVSDDGTTIGYRQIGQGRKLIICHGGGRISQNYEKLAAELAASFTVCIPDRRGRGLSGPEGPWYNIGKATEDLAAVIRATAAGLIFGHSAGGLIALETMLHTPVKKLAVYEPPVSVNNSFPLAWFGPFRQALQARKYKRAMALSLKGLNVIEGMGKMPVPAIMGFINILALLEHKKEKGTRMLDLLPALEADVQMVVDTESQAGRYHGIALPVSLMGGSASPAYFHTSLQALSGILPTAQLTMLDGLDHYSPEANVTAIARHLEVFFAEGVV